MFKFKYNEIDTILSLEDDYIIIGKDKIDLNTSELEENGRVYLKITNDCNLNCIYCFQKNDSRMKSDIDIKSYYHIINEATNNLQKDITIFGGEPLIDENIEVLKDIFNIFSSKKKISFFTNGCYSNEIFELLTNNKSSIDYLVITLDGPEKIHNKRRILKENNSYKIITNNLVKLEKENIPYIVQVNVDNNNIDFIEELFEELDLLIGLKNLNIILNRVLRSKNTITEIDLLKKFRVLIKKYKDFNIDVNSKIYKNLATYIAGNGYNKARCGIGTNTMVLDFITNKIYSCPQEIKTNIGFFTDKNINIDNAKVSKMRDVAYKNNNICDKCSYRKVCSNGCYLEKGIKDLKCKERIEESLEFIFKNFNDLFC